MAIQSLVSNLFRNDVALKACLVDDRSHILSGACGAHVAKIQLALAILDDAHISLAELRAKRYGGSTALAVFAYKKRRKIINYSYQTQADNIVGKMTIAALDREMLAWEQRWTRNRYYCGDPIQGGTMGTNRTLAAVRFTGLGAPFQQRVGSPSPTTRTIVPADLDILWQPSTGAVNANRVLKYLIKAISMLKPFGMGIMSSVAAPPDAPFPYDLEVNAEKFDDCLAVRKAAETVRPGFPKVLRILACPFLKKQSDTFGATHPGTSDGVFPQFILLNTATFRTDESTLLHEMIHAADLSLRNEDHDKDEDSIFSWGTTRTVLKAKHAAVINKAFFARPKP